MHHMVLSLIFKEHKNETIRNEENNDSKYENHMIEKSTARKGISKKGGNGMHQNQHFKREPSMLCDALQRAVSLQLQTRLDHSFFRGDKNIENCGCHGITTNAGGVCN